MLEGLLGLDARFLDGARVFHVVLLDDLAESLGRDVRDLAITVGDASGHVFVGERVAETAVEPLDDRARHADGSHHRRAESRNRHSTQCANEAGAIDARRALAAASDLRGRIPAFPAGAAGAAVCELEVDAETGTVVITRYTTVDDVGQAINPLIVDGQTHGGIAQGVGQALGEGVALDRDSGQLLAGSFMDYGLTRADDLPSFDLSLAEDPTGGNPLRVKGGGEGGIVPATAAVINALCDALCEYDVEDMPMPATPLAIWRAMQGPGKTGGGNV